VVGVVHRAGPVVGQGRSNREDRPSRRTWPEIHHQFINPSGFFGAFVAPPAWEDPRVTLSVADLSGGSDAAIRAALASGDLGCVETLFDALWYDLPDRFAREVVAATRAVGPDELDRRPRLLHATFLAEYRLGYGAEDPQLRKVVQFFRDQGRRYGLRLSSVRSGDLLTAGTMAVISARLQGDLESAERLGAWVDKQVMLGGARRVLPVGRTEVPARPGWLAAQRGLTAALAGQLDHAVQLYQQARAQAGRPPRAHYAGVNAVANLALLAAYRGHLDLARQWLDELERLGAVPAWMAHLSTAGAKIARALVAVEELDRAAAAAHLADAGSATQSIELWPFLAYAHALYDSVWDDPHRGLARLDEARFSHGVGGAAGTAMTGELLVRAEGVLLGRARAVSRIVHLRDERAPGDALGACTAWAHVRAGQHHEAIQVAVQAIQAGPRTVSDVVALNAALAVAHLRLGHTDRAAAAFASAVHARSGPRHRRPFLAVDPDALRQLSEATGLDVDVPLPEQRRATVGDPPVRLTPREHAVLAHLSEGSTAAKVAASLGVAPTTVRTQIRSIYKKLGASTRAEALARAHDLGLVPARPLGR
jgi:LuxR family maltose regulon positive regulatory protein